MQFSLPLVLSPLVSSVISFPFFICSDSKEVHVDGHHLASSPALLDDDVIYGADLILLVVVVRRDDVRPYEGYQSRRHDQRTRGRRVGSETETFVTVYNRMFVDRVFQIIDVRRDSLGRMVLQYIINPEDEDGIYRLWLGPVHQLEHLVPVVNPPAHDGLHIKVAGIICPARGLVEPVKG